MEVTKTSLQGVLVIEPVVFGDKRGFFAETYHQKRYDEWGITSVFVQDNISSSIRGTLRGLHFQRPPHAQAKMVQVIVGEIFDVAVDIRRGSPTFGQWTGMRLSDENKRQLYVPEGFAHGFCVLSETALVLYKCNNYYAPESEGGVTWSDPALGIDWPVEDPLLSVKDAKYPLLKDVPLDSLPVYEEGR